MVEQDIKDASRAREDYALQQSVIASLSQQALLGDSLQQLFDDAVRRARETLGVSHSKVMELQADHDLDHQVRDSALWDKYEVLRSVPGVALVSSVALLSALPELGRLNRGENRCHRTRPAAAARRRPRTASETG